MFQRDDRPMRIVASDLESFLETLRRLMAERGPLVWLVS